jgi:carbamoyl-phosphate synthase large subunit
MRDCDDNAVVICSIENLDPMGIHTGDSIAVAPAQTLTDREYQRMRDAAIAVLRAIGVDTGGANIQFAVHPESGQMVVIEMNPRVSRSSALASKATGYPIAKVAALLAVGYRLDEIPNDITRRTTAAFEPALDYVVVKVPRFQLEKFSGADPRLTTQMKSVGEVMAMGRTFNEALGKALRSLELDATPKLDFDHIRQYLANPTPERLAYVFAALRRGFPVPEIADLTGIDRWFLDQLARFIGFEERLRATPWEEVSRETLRQAKLLGFSDRELGEVFDISEEQARRRREQADVQPVFKMVDTCAAEFEAATPYFYSTYGGTENEAHVSSRRKVIILGSGPNRIGQGIEFDYANVHAVWALQEEGYETIMINSNPETVSTDYDTSDRLYFEPLTSEDVLAIVAHEEPVGVVVGFGGQTPLKLARTLVREGVPLLGSGFDVINLAENREEFGALLDRLELQSPEYGVAADVSEALDVAESLGYPVLIRPSYILGGRAVQIVDSPQDLRHYVGEAVRVSAGHPILIDRFLGHAVEMDVDVLTDGEDVWIAGLMEQIEEAGVHSGDSACVLPPVSLSGTMVDRIEDAVARLVRAMSCVGLVNIQVALQGDELYVLEANPRASRTVPFVSKAIGIPVAKLAAKILVGRPLGEVLAPYWPYPWLEAGDHPSSLSLDEILDAEHLAPTPWPSRSSVKEAVLPFGRFPGSDVLLGPEMRSTGEVMSFGDTFPEAFAKAQIAARNPLPTEGTVLISLADPDKREGASLVSQLHDWGFDIVATRGTARVLQAIGIPAQAVLKVGEGRPDVVDLIAQGEVSLVVNTPSSGQAASPSRRRGSRCTAPLPDDARTRGLPLSLEGKRTVGYRIRQAALKYHIPYATTLVAFRAATAAIRSARMNRSQVCRLQTHLGPTDLGG